jgi:CubicO group peptidase (beta-lactamase class C family)
MPLSLPALVLASLLAQTPDVTARLTKTLDSLAAAGEFSGVALLAKDGAPVFERSYGLADREARTPNTIETAFNLGSINKFFTQVAIRQLADAGKLDVDSSLARAWPGYPNQDVARRVTIRELLQHRSGVGGNIFAAPASGKRSDIRRLADYFQLFVNEPLQFEPGSQQRYSNAGYIVLGLLVERLSGENYYDYVRRHIYEPAGLTRTGSWAVDSLPTNTAVGYTRGAQDAPASTPVAPNTSFLPGRGSSAGGGYSTAHDLLRLINALRAGKIPSGPPAGIGIAGGAPGLNAAMEGDLPGGYDVIVLANLDPPAAERVARIVRGWLNARD